LAICWPTGRRRGAAVVATGALAGGFGAAVGVARAGGRERHGSGQRRAAATRPRSPHTDHATARPCVGQTPAPLAWTSRFIPVGRAPRGERAGYTGRVRGWRQLYPHPIAGPDDAGAFVAALGLCTWGPVPGLDFPNLAEAMGHTARSVLDQTWFWKDDLHLARRVYYGRIVRGQPTFVAPELLPDLIAALGPAERDVAGLYRDGRLGREARAIHDHLVDHPRQPTRELRRGAGLRGTDQAAPTERALIELQRRLLICKVDLTGRTRGTYGYVWDLAERFWPEAFDEAGRTAVPLARAAVRAALARAGVALPPAQEARLLLWH